LALCKWLRMPSPTVILMQTPMHACSSPCSSVCRCCPEAPVHSPCTAPSNAWADAWLLLPAPVLSPHTP
jgi:hypothetical protein